MIDNLILAVANTSILIILARFYRYSLLLHSGKRPKLTRKQRRRWYFKMQTPYVHDEEIDEGEIEEIEEEQESQRLDFNNLDLNNLDIDPDKWLTPELMEQLEKDGIKLPQMEELQQLIEQEQGQEQKAPAVAAPNKQTTRKPVKKKREIKPEHKNYAAMLHLSSLLFIMRIPFANIVLPALFWLYKKDESKFIDFNGREVINFQISLVLIELVFSFFGLILMYIAPSIPLKLLQITTPIRYMINSVFPLPVTIFTVIPFFIAVNCIVAGSIQAYRGIGFRYKFSYPFTELPKLLANNVKGVDVAAKEHAR